MNLLPSADQEQVLDTLRGFLAERAPVERLRNHGAIGNPDETLWSALAELGFLSLGLSEADGGVGLGAAEEMLSVREFGRNVISPSIVALILAARIAESGVRAAIISGAAKVGFANARGPGEVHVFEGLGADHVLIVEEERAGLFPARMLTDRRPVSSTDASLSLERAKFNPDAKGVKWSGGKDIACRARLLLAAYAAGLSEGARDMAVAYAKVREQFGKPIGSFQSIKHLCAEMAIRSEAALCQASFSALMLDAGHKDADYHATAAKIVCVDAALRNAADNIQVHGAFGFTAEAHAHHYLKRAHVIDLLWGNIKAQQARLLAMPTAD